ncbi:DUF4383 domain-containing protein [Amycolatopsis pigmentata]|uniref:DUF4383 domain-containing protein n=1 Tax=Amycolatopsis pigmentata TaxID=450801 RepID=A0ABW5G3I9_9PSEU
MTGAQEARVRLEGFQPAQVFATVIAVLCVILGAIGLLRTANGDLVGNHEVVAGLTLNRARALVYIGFGALGLVEATVSVTARAYGVMIFAGFGLLFVWGLMVNGLIPVNPLAERGNPLSLELPDDGLHLVIAIAGLLTAVLPARKALYVGAVRVMPPPGSATEPGTPRLSPSTWPVLSPLLRRFRAGA